MAMITSIAANKSGGERTAERSGVAVQASGELAVYYAALLRHTQAHQAELGEQSYALGITSCTQAAGVTTVAINLATMAARSGSRRVLLIDGNGKRPHVAHYLGLSATSGLADVLSGAAMLGDSLHRCSISGVSILPAGDAARQLGTDFEVAAIADLLDELKSEFDLIVFDLPQADELSECYAFAQALNGVFLVVEAGKVDARMARRVVERLQNCQATLLGAIYNKQP